jgi:signal transduction histidine kinase
MSDLFGMLSLSQHSQLVVQDLPKQRILVVADGMEHVGLVEAITREIDAELMSIKSPLEAAEYCASQLFSVILYAADMQSEESVKTAQTVVQNELSSETPVIFLSRVSEPDQLNFSLHKSAPADYVAWPVATHIIISKVNVFLSLQIQRLAILQMGKNLDENHNFAATLPIETGQRGVVAADAFVNSAAGSTASDVVVSSERLDAMTHLSATVAHDLNNILAIILGNLELLGYEGIQDSKIQARLAPIQGAAERACVVTNQLLGFSRRSPKKAVVTDVNRVLVGMEQLILPELCSAVKLAWSLNDSLWQTTIDPDDLQDAVLHLIQNACDAMPDGGKLAVETSNVSFDEDSCSSASALDAGDYVALLVSDTGHGIPADIRPFVFDPLFSSNDKTGSKGMGLSQVYGFCQRSKGHIRLRSDPDIGTVVLLYLPRSLG